MKDPDTTKEREAISLRRTLLRNLSRPIIIMLVALLVTVIVSGFFLLNSIVENQHAVLDGLSGVADQYFHETGLLVHTISDTYRYLENDQMTEYLDHLREVYPRFIAIYILDQNGRVTIESLDGAGVLGLDLSGEEFFQGELGGEMRYSDPFLSLFSNQIVVTVVNQIGSESGENEGVLVAELNLELLQEKVEQVHGGDLGETFIIDSKGVYLAHPDINSVERREYFSPVAIYEGVHDDQHSYQILRSEESDLWQIATFAKLDIGWTIISTQPLNEVFKPVYIELAIAAGALAIVFLEFLFNIRYKVRQISQPLALLAEKAEKISRGIYSDLEVEKPRQYREVVSLEDSFSRMIRAIQERDQTLERRVEERTIQLAEANQDLESFMYSVSHDLRAPLRAINGFSNFLSEEYLDELDEEGKFYLERILSNSLKMDELINDLLDLSRLGRQSIELEQVDVTKLVENIVEKIKEQYHPCQAEFTIADCPPMTADRHLLEIMLTNLIGNAVKFTRNSPEPKVEFGCVSEGFERTYFVRDNGIGFNMDFADKLYQPFQRLHADSNIPGSGIGLAIVSRIVRSHDGKVWVESEEGAGTTFYFTLD